MRPLRLTGLLAVAALTACGGSNTQDLAEYVAKVRARTPGPIEPLPEIKQVATFVYDPGDRRDPFLMDVEDEVGAERAPGGGIAPDPTRRKEELEHFALDSLKMVGTLAQGDTTWALVKSPEGVLHRVRVGNYLGLNNGQIMRIGDNQIQVTEIVNEGGGEWRERQAAIALTQ
jgi:type IV pilus assembly protein PilP